MSDISTFDLENHNHIFKSQNPAKIQKQKKKEYEPPKIILIDNLDFSYKSSSSDSEEFESAIEFLNYLMNFDNIFDNLCDDIDLFQLFCLKVYELNYYQKLFQN